MEIRRACGPGSVAASLSHDRPRGSKRPGRAYKPNALKPMAIMTTEISRRAIVPVLAAGALPGCSTLRPGGLTDRARDVAYGRHPRQRMDIYVPQGGGTDRPVVFFIYGGSWANGSKETYAFVGEAFAARGFVTVIADYRLVPEVRFPVFIEDGALALRFVRDNIARYGGAPRQVHVIGHSAGAYNAMMLTLDRRYLAAAGLPSRYIRSAVGLSGPYDFLPSTSRSRRLHSETPATSRKRSRSTSRAATLRRSFWRPAPTIPSCCRATASGSPARCNGPARDRSLSRSIPGSSTPKR